MKDKYSTIINIHQSISESQALETQLYIHLESYKKNKTEIIAIVRKINAYVIRRRKLFSQSADIISTINCTKRDCVYIEHYNTHNELIEQENVLNEQKNQLKLGANVLIPLEINVIKSIEINTHNFKYYRALLDISRHVFIMLIILNVIAIIGFLLPIPSFIIDTIRVLVFTYYIVYMFIMIREHNARDDTDYDKFKFASMVPSKIRKGGSEISDTTQDQYLEVDDKSNQIESCDGDACCSDEMYYDNIKNKCVVGEQIDLT